MVAQQGARFNGEVAPPAPSVIAVVSDDPRVGPALVSYLRASMQIAQIEGPIPYSRLTDDLDAAVAICDLDGTDLSAALAQINALVGRAGLRVIALSASPRSRLRAIENGALHAADKSIETDHLIDLVDAALVAFGR